MPRFLNPPTAPKPASRYSQAVAMGAPYKRVVVSGQIGVSPAGVLAEGLEAQMAQAFDNFLAIVTSAGLGAADVVKIVCYVTQPDAIAIFRRIREAKFGSNAPACTYLQVAGLADPGYLVEIEGEAQQEAAAAR